MGRIACYNITIICILISTILANLIRFFSKSKPQVTCYIVLTGKIIENVDIAYTCNKKKSQNYARYNICLTLFVFTQKTELEAQWVEPVLFTFYSALRKLNTESSIGASYQISIHLAIQFQRRRFFRNRPTRNKNCLWRPCLLTDWA